MELFISIVGFAILIAVVGFVLHNHWQEVHGDNHF
jgi:hypothetical protein